MNESWSSLAYAPVYDTSWFYSPQFSRNKSVRRLRDFAGKKRSVSGERWKRQRQEQRLSASTRFACRVVNYFDSGWGYCMHVLSLNYRAHRYCSSRNHRHLALGMLPCMHFLLLFAGRRPDCLGALREINLLPFFPPRKCWLGSRRRKRRRRNGYAWKQKKNFAKPRKMKKRLSSDAPLMWMTQKWYC